MVFHVIIFSVLFDWPDTRGGYDMRERILPSHPKVELSTTRIVPVALCPQSLFVQMTTIITNRAIVLGLDTEKDWCHGIALVSFS